MDLFVLIFFSPLSLLIYCILIMLFLGYRGIVWNKRKPARSISGIFLWIVYILIGIICYIHNYNMIIWRLTDILNNDGWIMFSFTALLSLWGIKRAKQSLNLINFIDLETKKGENNSHKIGFNPRFRLLVFQILLAASVIGMSLSIYSHITDKEATRTELEKD